MRAVPAARRLGFVVALAGALAACGGAGAVAPTPTMALNGRVTIFAAASLTEAFGDAEHTLEQRDPGFAAAYSFAGSQQLVTNVANGAPADVIATANTSTMQTLVSAGLVETPRVFARNRLEIAVAPGNPKRISTLADLSRTDLSVVLADPSVPAGDFAEQVLHKAGVTLTPKSLELDVKSALQKVAAGDADAAIVYTTDIAAAAGTVEGVLIPDAQNVVAMYVIAVVKATQHAPVAQAFVESAVSGDIQRAVQARGFLPPA